MAGFNLSGLTDRISQVLSDNVSFSSLLGKNDQALLDLINSLSNGETIVGKVLSSNEDSFQISTGNNVIINAKAESGILLTEGSNVLFEVNKLSEGKVSLRPLYQNVSSAETAKTALNQAGIPINDRTLEMTVRNMEYGNPIDRNGILSSYKDVLTFEEFPVKYIVDLQKMEIPVTHNNLVQYETFMNMKNIVSDSFMDVSEGIMTDLSSLAEQSLSTSNLTVSNLINNEAILDTKGMIDSVLKYCEPSTENTSSQVFIHELDIVKLSNELKNYGFSSANTDEIINKDSELINLQKTVDYPPKTVLRAVFNDINDTVNRQISDIFNQKSDVQTPKYDLLFKSSEIKNLIFKAFASDWSLKEEDITKNSVTGLYKKLYENTKSLADNLSVHLRPESNSLNMVNNINNNIDFMDQLNKYIPYVQIPLNDNPNNKAELYVYKNKKNLTAADGEISAFLHLDMEHLGRTDVMIKMLNNNVSTNFKLANDEALSLIEENIHFLDKRLNEKGYSLSVKTELAEKVNSPIQEMLNNNESHLVLAKTSFDARI